MPDFARGARIKPKAPQRPEVPINEEMSFPEFMFYVGSYVVRDYRIRDRELFLLFCGCAFDAAMEANPSAQQQKPNEP